MLLEDVVEVEAMLLIRYNGADGCRLLQGSTAGVTAGAKVRAAMWA